MTRDNIFLERMRRPEVEAALAHGVTTIVVPCGAVEQHGPHLPLFVDAEHGTYLGEEVARRMGDTLVAPAIRVGCSEHHMDFPGTLSLEPATFVAVCRDYCVSLSRHGFQRLCLLPSHGGNFSVLRDALPELNQAVGPDCSVAAFTDLIAVLEVWRQVVETESGLGKRVGGHADIAETSIMLALHPDLVSLRDAEEGYAPELRGDVINRIIEDGFKSVTPNGILGDARGATTKMGRRCVAELADVMAKYFLQAK